MHDEAGEFVYEFTTTDTTPPGGLYKNNKLGHKQKYYVDIPWNAPFNNK